MAIVQSIKHFHHYLYGQQFLVRTDHGSLKWLLQFKNPEGQIARWLETLSSYQFRIEHRNGRSHGNADALSRRPCIEYDCKYCMRAEEKYSPENPPAHCSVTTRLQSSLDCEPSTSKSEKGDNHDNTQNSNDNLSKLQLEDPDLKHVILWVRNKVKPEWQDISHLSETCKYFWARYDSLFYENGILYHKWQDVCLKNQAIVPKVLVKEVIQGSHDSITGGHLGIKKTLSRIQDKYFWFQMVKDVKHWCTVCDKCAMRKNPQKFPRAPLQKYTVGVPMERLAIDVMGPLPMTNKKNSYLLVIGDYFTKWVDAIPIRNQKASTIAQKVLDRIITIFGVPMQIHSDQGRSFESKIFQEMCKLLGIEKTRTTPYRPQSDGMIERANRTIANMLTAFVDKNQKNWDDLIPLLMMAYRSTKHEATGVSPCEMLLGRPITLPVDIALGRVDPVMKHTYKSEYAYNLAQKLSNIHEFAREKLEKSSQNMLRDYNTKIHHNHYQTHDPVWLFIPKSVTKGKFHNSWAGPYRIYKRINDVLYQIKKGPKSRPKTVHHNHLKPYMGQNLPSW